MSYSDESDDDGPQENVDASDPSHDANKDASELQDTSAKKRSKKQRLCLGAGWTMGPKNRGRCVHQ
jgi:hypothetical protein